MANPSGQVIVRSAGTGYTPSGPAPEFTQLDVNGNGSIDATTEAVGYKFACQRFPHGGQQPRWSGFKARI